MKAIGLMNSENGIFETYFLTLIKQNIKTLGFVMSAWTNFHI